MWPDQTLQLTSIMPSKHVHISIIGPRYKTNNTIPLPCLQIAYVLKGIQHTPVSCPSHQEFSMNIRYAARTKLETYSSVKVIQISHTVIKKQYDLQGMVLKFSDSFLQGKRWILTDGIQRRIVLLSTVILNLKYHNCNFCRYIFQIFISYVVVPSYLQLSYI